MKFITLPLLFISLTLSITANAGLLDAGSYIDNDANEMFWTNNDLGLDVMRLSWSHFLKNDGEKGDSTTTLDSIESFLTSEKNHGWQWATDAQFDDLYMWFDSNLDHNGWSIEQEIGSRLFFELNGFAPMHGENGYRDDIGITAWYWFSNTETTHLREATIQDFYGPDFPCTNSSFCQSSDMLSDGYHNKGRYVDAKESLLINNVEYPFGNVGALLIRTTQVPEPSTLAIFSLALVALLSRKKLQSNKLK